MRHKDVETMREIRLWVGQIIVPAALIVLSVPETRSLAIEKIKSLKQKYTKKNK